MAIGQIEISRRLQKLGVPEAIAQEHALILQESIEDKLATKDDLNFLREQVKLDLTLALRDVDKRFDNVDRRFESIDKRFESIDKRFDDIDKRFDNLREEVNQEFAIMHRDLKQYIVGAVFLILGGILGVAKFFHG